ncbi:hypothetical protein [Sorangium cellulosum]|uniref:hypothetical protein n=1 Tax=Sorangium cellulosum TaxID=56 RepID=UPI0013311BE2|nr:hypothetical protein [Sorangium cellulosum]
MNTAISRALVRAWIAVALVLLPCAGRADAAEGGPEERLRRSADRAVASGLLAEARDLWLQIWQLERSEQAACNVGQLSLRIADMPRAAEFLTACLARAPAPADADARARHASRALDLARAKQAVGALTFAAPRGAELSIGGRPLGRAPLGREVFVAPGSHRVRAALGDVAKEVAVEVRAGEARLVVLDLAALASAAPAAGLMALGGVASAACVVLGAVFLDEADENEREFDMLLERNHGGYRIAGAELQRAQGAYVAMERAEERAAFALAAGALVAGGTLVYALFPRSDGPGKAAAGARLRVEPTAAGARLRLEATW